MTSWSVLPVPAAPHRQQYRRPGSEGSLEVQSGPLQR